jgi:hypothetical protein
MNAWDNPLWVQGMIVLGIPSCFLLYLVIKDIVKKAKEKPDNVSWFGGLKFP